MKISGTLSLLLLSTGFLACSTAPSTTENPAPLPQGGVSHTESPLGLGYPDPNALLETLLQRLEARDFEGTCALLAGPRKSDGRPVPLIPGRNVFNREDIWVPLEDVRGLRQFLAQPWKRLNYGATRTVMNDPPFIAVPVRVTYDFDRVPDMERALLVRSLAEQTKQPATWSDVVRELEAQDRLDRSPGATLPELGFVHLDRSWRLWLGGAPAKKP